jgi:hypothetical protein
VAARSGRVTGLAGDLATLATDTVPFAVLAVSTYGRAVLAAAWDDVADASIKAGLKVLQLVFGHRKQDEALPDVVAEVIDNQGDQDYLNQLKLTIRKALEHDEVLAEKVAAIVAEARPSQTATQNVVAGHNAYVFGCDGFVAGRDVRINDRRDQPTL